MSSTVVVTGGRGFIGSRLVARLDGSGRQVQSIDLPDFDVTTASPPVPEGAILVHLAARMDVHASWQDPVGHFQVNALGVVRMLDAAVRARAAGFVYLNTYPYGAPKQLPIDESHPTVALTPYHLAKTQGEAACRFFAENCGLNCDVFRVFNVYGPGQAGEFLVPIIARQVADAAIDTIRVRDLAPRRDYIFVDDVVDAIVTALETLGGFRVFNLGSGVSHSVADIIAMAQSVAGTAKPVEAPGERRRSEVDDVVADISRLTSATGWRPKTDLATGLAACLEAIR